MDFAFTEEQRAVAEAASGVFAGTADAERVAAVERSDDRFDEVLWHELARANLLGLAVPEAHGGSGLAMTELGLVLEQQGRHVAPVPLWATTVLGALPLARFGTPQQQAQWLPGVVTGDVRLTAALNEVAASAQYRPAVTAVPDGAGWRLSGTAVAVPQAHVAHRVLVPASGPAGVLVALVDPHGQGVSLERAETTDRQVHPHVRLDGVPVGPGDLLGTEGTGPGGAGGVAPTSGGAILTWMLERAATGLCALALGVSEEAVRRSAAYLNQRHQFGRPLSSFQGAMLRAADAYIDTEAMRATTWQAAWRLDTGRPADQAVAVAKWWASEAGQRVVHAAQHLHGGLGADVEYPIHRYFLWGKQIELMLEGPSATLYRLGQLVAHELAAAGASAAGGPPVGTAAS